MGICWCCCLSVVTRRDSLLQATSYSLFPTPWSFYGTRHPHPPRPHLPPHRRPHEPLRPLHPQRRRHLRKIHGHQPQSHLGSHHVRLRPHHVPHRPPPEVARRPRHSPPLGARRRSPAPLEETARH